MAASPGAGRGVTSRVMCKPCTWHCTQAEGPNGGSNGWAMAEQELRNLPGREQPLCAAFPGSTTLSPGYSAESRASLYLGYAGPSLPCLTGDWLFQ